MRSQEDTPGDNVNKTFYRNQINKIALAIKEIISGLKNEPFDQVKAKQTPGEPTGITDKQKRETEKEKPAIWTRKKLFSTLAIIAILVVFAIFAYPKLFRKNMLEKLKSADDKISVVVMPFQNMTSDTAWNIWQAGIQNELIASLTNLEELKVRQTETVNSLLKSRGLTNYASIAPSVASRISQNLDANVLISGSINQSGTTIRLSAQLINSRSEDVFKSFQIDGTSEKILYIIDSLSAMVRNYLIIARLVKELPAYVRHHPGTVSSEAYRYYLYGENARSNLDYSTARKMFAQALAIDSNFVYATLMLSVACSNQGLYKEGRKWIDEAYAKRDQMPLRMKILTNSHYALFYETPVEENMHLRQFLEIDDQFPGTYYDIGLNYSSMLQYDKAIPEFEKSLEIYDKLDMKPWWIFNYTELGDAYHATGQYKKEKKLYKKADRHFPNHPAIIWGRAILSLSEGDTVSANKYITKYKTLRRENGWTEASIAYSVGLIYTKAGNLDKAEEYHRLEQSLEPDNSVRNYDLGWFLLNKDRNINEGLEFIDRALELRPDIQWYLLNAKGWGLYKQGKYKEALELLEKSRDLSYYYRHDVYLHIEEVKKAIAGQ